MADRNERQLIDQLVAGRDDAWADFVRRYQGLVYSCVRRTADECRRALDGGAVEDICAEVFVSLLARNCATLRSFQGRSSLATWLAVITRRVCLKQINRRIPIAVESVPDREPHLADAAGSGGQPDALEQLIRAEDSDRLLRTMTRLGDGDRMILRLFYLDHLGYSEISDRLKISVNTVGPKLHRAQLRLRRLLEQQEPRVS